MNSGVLTRAEALKQTGAVGMSADLLLINLSCMKKNPLHRIVGSSFLDFMITKTIEPGITNICPIRFAIL